MYHFRRQKENIMWNQFIARLASAESVKGLTSSDDKIKSNCVCWQIDEKELNMTWRKKSDNFGEKVRK